MGGGILIVALAAASAAVSEAWKSQGIIHTDDSPYAKLHSVPVRAVKPGEGFWSKRMQVNADRSLPTMLELLEQHGAADNFRRLTGKKNAPRRGPLYIPPGGGARHADPGAELIFVPYYAWHNRGPGKMQVWIPAAAIRRP